MYKGIMNKKNVYFDELSSVKYFEILENKTYKTIKILKEDNRSIVKLIQIGSEELVLKIPVEKNTKKWQRFISLFRSGESSREFLNLEKILKNNFLGAKPYFAIESKKMGMTINSCILMEYIKGSTGKIEDLEIISATLNQIHEKGYLHGDSQLSNFMLAEGKAYLIDTKLIKNIYWKFGNTYEFIYLEESCNEDIGEYYNKKDMYYGVAKLFNRYLHFWGKIRSYVKKELRKKLNFKNRKEKK